ncbi:MAG TPA: hypothetical protein VHA30_00350 [Patescibacteria group bacterium]|nr:hypothetical protein [Patescibacteria group bacterium]
MGMDVPVDAYLDRFVKTMEREGYKLFSRVPISNADRQYWIQVVWVRETALFFHLPNRRLIVQAVFHERSGVEWSQYWTFRFYTWLSGTTVVNQPLYQLGFNIPGFFDTAGCYEQDGGQVLDPQNLACSITDRMRPIIPRLAEDRFPRLDVRGFCPYRHFPGSENIFWGRFNRIALQEIVRYPFGEGFA